MSFKRNVIHQDINYLFILQMARKKRSLKLLRLARDKKSLIWQKKYLSKVLEQQYRKQCSESIYTETISSTNAKTLFELKVSSKYQQPLFYFDQYHSYINLIKGYCYQKFVFISKTYQNPGMESDALSSNTESRSNVNIVFGNHVDLIKKKFK